MKHEIVEQNEKIVVTASLRRRKFARDEVKSIETKDIVALLVKSGYNIEKYRVVKQGSCSNYKPGSNHSDEWVFELKKTKEETNAESTTKTPTRSRKRRNTNSQKNQLLRNENMGRVRTQTQTDLSGQD